MLISFHHFSAERSELPRESGDSDGAGTTLPTSFASPPRRPATVTNACDTLSSAISFHFFKSLMHFLPCGDSRSLPVDRVSDIPAHTYNSFASHLD